MADEAPVQDDPVTKGIFIIILLWLVAALIDRIPKLILQHTGINIFHPIDSIRHISEVTASTPLGSHVKTIIGTDVFSAPGGGTLLGFQPKGALGFLTHGPSAVDGLRWWDVTFTEGASGWVPERTLENLSGFAFLHSVVTYGFIVIVVLCVVLALLLAVITYRLNTIRGAEARKIRAALPTEETPRTNERWETILAHAGSQNPNDWRLAIIEADVVLDELVTRMGYRGESLGAKLKQIEPSDFLTLDDAWEAHKTRNKIAHSGSDFVLTQREARRVVDLYANVFREFHYI